MISVACPDHCIQETQLCGSTGVFACPDLCNFAFATYPGGGVTWGSTAQEECLCRCSTLYANLTDQKVWKPFYAAHKGNDVVILGAYGCGAFSNPPDVVAAAMRQVEWEYRYYFKIVEFAAYCAPRHDRNYRVFMQLIG